MLIKAWLRLSFSINFPKGRLLQNKRWPFTLSKTAFHKLKDGFLGNGLVFGIKDKGISL